MRDFPRASRVPPRAILSTAKASGEGLPERGWAAPSLELAAVHG
jgi:hypothetical protein